MHYGDWNDENTPPLLDNLTGKLQIAEVRKLLVGPDCPHVVRENRRARDRNTKDHLCFSLERDNGGDNLDFIAPDQKRFDYWTDGISALLRRRMTSTEADKDLEMLLSMEIKIRLLDVEGIDIPEEPPEIPSLPNNFDFWQEA